MTDHRKQIHDIATAVVAGLRLPPQFHIRLANYFDVEDIVIHIDAVFPDVYDTSKESQTFKSAYLWVWLRDLPLDAVRGVLIEELHQTARTLWLHEFDEWVTVDGQHVNEPHPPGHPSVILGLLTPEAQAQITRECMHAAAPGERCVRSARNAIR